MYTHKLSFSRLYDYDNAVYLVCYRKLLSTFYFLLPNVDMYHPFHQLYVFEY